MKFRQNLFFSWAYSIKTDRNSLMKGTSLGCQLCPETIPIARNCAVWAVALSQTPLESIQLLDVLGPVKFPAQKFGNFVTTVRMWTTIHVVYYKSRQIDAG